MKNIRGIMFVIVAMLALMVVGVASAQVPTGEPSECTAVEDEGSVEGTIIGVDEDAGTADLLLEDGTCVTVSLEQGDYDHPVVELLAEYFGGTTLGEYSDALDVLEENDIDPAEVESYAVEDGVLVVTLTDGTTVEFDDADLAGDVEDALDLVSSGDFDVALDEDGNATVGDVGEQIEEYHEDGVGFGVLVKLYAIAEESAEACAAQEEDAGGEEAEADAGAGEGETTEGGEEEVDDCAVTVDQLVLDFQSGMGMGQIFRLYGKPSLLGVGHVRQALGSEDGGDSGTTTGDSGDGQHGICNARSHDGQANANGQGEINCP